MYAQFWPGAGGGWGRRGEGGEGGGAPFAYKGVVQRSKEKHLLEKLFKNSSYMHITCIEILQLNGKVLSTCTTGRDAMVNKVNIYIAPDQKGVTANLGINFIHFNKNKTQS